MSFQVKAGKRIANVELLSRDGNHVALSIDGKEYLFDLLKVGEGIFSILHKGKSYSFELVPGENIRKYTVHTYKTTYETQIIDSETKYLQNRMKGLAEDAENVITAPIPGKVVKIAVETGEEIKAGQTLIILSAMKMESEFKAKKDGVVREIKVKEGQTVNAREVMVVIE